MREVEKTPEFEEDIAEVSTTKFTTEAAPASPASANMATNGDCSGSIARHGMTTRMASREPT